MTGSYDPCSRMTQDRQIPIPFPGRREGRMQVWFLLARTLHLAEALRHNRNGYKVFTVRVGSVFRTERPVTGLQSLCACWWAEHPPGPQRTLWLKGWGQERACEETHGSGSTQGGGSTLLWPRHRPCRRSERSLVLRRQLGFFYFPIPVIHTLSSPLAPSSYHQVHHYSIFQVIFFTSTR